MQGDPVGNDSIMHGTAMEGTHHRTVTKGLGQEETLGQRDNGIWVKTVCQCQFSMQVLRKCEYRAGKFGSVNTEVRRTSILSAQFYCEPKIAPTSKIN